MAPGFNLADPLALSAAVRADGRSIRPSNLTHIRFAAVGVREVQDGLLECFRVVAHCHSKKACAGLFPFGSELELAM